jgi:hypothetical protein
MFLVRLLPNFVVRNQKNKVMKSIILSISAGVALLATGFVANTSTVADNYKVIKVDGKITYVKSGKDLITGDLFASNEKLSFKTQESRAAVISSVNGRFVLTPDAKGGNASNLLPAMSNVATRSGALINALDLKNHFSENYLLLEEMELKINAEVYPMDKNNFFYLQYELNGENIPKRLDYHDDILELTAKEIFTVDGKSLPIPEKTKMAIYYRNDDIKKSTKISEFFLVSPDSENLKLELEVILGEIKGKDVDTKTNEIAAYLYEFYGKPQKENLKDWLEKNMNL